MQATTDRLPAAEPLHCTDAGNAERFVRDHGARVRYDHTRERWLLWTGSQWAEDATEEVLLLARETARRIPAEALQASDQEQYERILKWALRSEAATRLRAMIDTINGRR